MLNKKHILILLVAIMFSLSCGKSQQKIDRDKSVKDAAEALKKIQAATEVGVNFGQYGNLLIEAKAKVNDATGKLAAEPELKKNFEEAMQGYADAAGFWQFKIKDIDIKIDETDSRGEVTHYRFDDSRKVSELVEKYKLEPETVKNVYQNFRRVDADKSRQACWLWSRVNLNRIEETNK